MFLLFLAIGAFSYLPAWSWVLILFAAYVVYYYWRVSKYPKGPFPYPIIGNIPQITPNQLQHDLERFRKIYGNVFTVWFLNQPMVILCREEAIKEALITKSDSFLDRPIDFVERIFQVVDNGGIIFSSGDNWREQRRNALHILRDFGVGKNLMEQQIHEQLERFTESVRKIEDKDAADLNWPIQVLIANVINNILYGFSYEHDKSERLMDYTIRLTTMLREMFGNLGALLVQLCPPAIHIPFIGYHAAGKHVEKYKYCLEFVKEDVKNTLANYSVEEEPNCVAQAYFQQMDKNEALDMDNLYNVCADFFFAGMETTATTLRWAILYMAEYQDVQDKMREEISKVVGYNRLPSLKDRPNLPYCTAVVHELQRKINIVGFNLQRKNNKDIEVFGKKIPAGSSCVPQIYSIMIDERNFPESEKFKPERFIMENGSLNTDLVGHMSPFGMGKRQCAGENLAKAELFLGLTAIVQRFKLLPQEGKKIDFDPIYGTFVNPKLNLLRLVEVNPTEL